MTTPPPGRHERLPVELMNTIYADRDGVHDALADVAGLAGWLRATSTVGALTELAVPEQGAPRLASAGLEMAVVDDALLGRFRALRDALRVLAAEVTGDPRPIAAREGRDLAWAVRTLNQGCAAAPSWSQLAWPPSGDPRRQAVTAAPPADAVLGCLAEDGTRLFGSGRARQLGACCAPGCVLYFLRDHARRQWCSDACGNRARVARHYARHHGQLASLETG